MLGYRYSRALCAPSPYFPRLKNNKLGASDRAAKISGNPSPSTSPAANPYVAPLSSPKGTRV